MWMIFVSVSICISLVMALLFCLCWKDRTPTNEWLGVDGMVTQKNPDENVNHLPSTANCKNGVANGETPDKRNAPTNSHRSLPDIPSELTAGVTWDTNGDNSSEHYATLGQYQSAGDKPSAVKGPEVRSSISQHSSISQADDTFSPYERVKYDKIKSKKEHPYAQVQPTSLRPPVYEETHTSSEERITLLRADIPSTSANPSTPIRSRRSSAQSNEPVDIPAATAVAGGIAASYELPYMTPPINFSGDSQDSSKGYTSISVREPLANILAQTTGVSKQKRKLDVHYSTVSDDSDDVYTTIPDPNNPIYNSESETYARIPPLPITVEAEINVPPLERISDERQEEIDELYEAPPQSVHASHSHTHSRQASSSSSGNFGSPKPEKRQANSPLPPPPTASSADFYTDKLQVKRNLDDLYAKVQKVRKEDAVDDGFSLSDKDGSVRSSFGISQVEGSLRNREHNYETLKKSSTTNSDFGYEKIKGGMDCEPGYASINGPDSLAASSDPGYEALREVRSESGPSFQQLKQGEDDVNNLGYSVVNKKKKAPSNQASFTPALGHPVDPNYAATKSSGSESDPNYESVNQSDPNYESVKDFEPFHEEGKVCVAEKAADVSDSSNSASRTTESEPPYERLRNEVDSDIPGYEKVGSNGSASSGIDVEHLQNEETDVSVNIHDEDAVVQV
ncbi:uncharacterized protein LOC109540707 isoform X1 [Dendroctonus ponderosae]|uniref:Uncharacterized protein n=2 Tax=Dendroctonus ponderosae TaxID=77166 RepID=U4U2F0_DENPD|nr:uncharacterized protein LOC109540707 isoform X1 [Dendroctonus ponderosae]ERL86478.1 hypothetical protein D910_03884 [Dendroctonus ponderosae]